MPVPLTWVTNYSMARSGIVPGAVGHGVPVCGGLAGQGSHVVSAWATFAGQRRGDSSTGKPL